MSADKISTITEATENSTSNSEKTNSHSHKGGGNKSSTHSDEKAANAATTGGGPVNYESELEGGDRGAKTSVSEAEDDLRVTFDRESL